MTRPDEDQLSTTGLPGHRTPDALDLDTATLRDLLAGLTTVKPYTHGETVYLYCGKACRAVKHTVMIYGDSEPFALCGYGGCMNKPALPVRYETTEDEVAWAALDALPALLDVVDNATTQQADAWDEGFTAGWNDGIVRPPLKRRTNPYRALGGEQHQERQ